MDGNYLLISAFFFKMKNMTAVGFGLVCDGPGRNINNLTKATKSPE
jgi:hypothetical protein